MREVNEEGELTVNDEVKEEVNEEGELTVKDEVEEEVKEEGELTASEDEYPPAPAMAAMKMSVRTGLRCFTH